MKPTRRDVLKAMPVAAAAGLAGCGYALAGRGSFLPAYIRTLGIPIFVNTTPYVTVEQIFTQKVRAEFQSRGTYTVVPADTGVDGVVRGDITSISLSPVGFTDVQVASRYRFTVITKVQFDDLHANKTLWENPALSFSDEYELANASGGAAVDASSFVGQQNAAIDRLSTDFAKSVVSAILEAF